VVEKGYSLLIKPFTMEQLERKVRAVLNNEARTMNSRGPE
jgi:DNA-binding response OmpR family regulator